LYSFWNEIKWKIESRKNPFMDSVLKIETNYYLNIIYKKTMSANTLYSFQFSLAQVFFQILKHMVGWLSGSVPGQLRLDIRGASRSRVRIPLRSLLIFTNERPCKGSRRSDLCRTNSMVQVTIVNIKADPTILPWCSFWYVLKYKIK
jgi:hypothetical protein